MSKHHSDKWLIETLRDLLSPDIEIVDDDGATIVYCHKIDYYEWGHTGEQHAEQLADVLREIQKQEGGRA